MVPFQGTPVTEPLPSLNTIANELMGLEKEVSMRRTAPLKPPAPASTAPASAVMPPPVTATAALRDLLSVDGAPEPWQAARMRPTTTAARGLEAETFPRSFRVASMKTPSRRDQNLELPDARVRWHGAVERARAALAVRIRRRERVAARVATASRSRAGVHGAGRLDDAALVPVRIAAVVVMVVLDQQLRARSGACAEIGHAVVVVVVEVHARHVGHLGVAAAHVVEIVVVESDVRVGDERNEVVLPAAHVAIPAVDVVVRKGDGLRPAADVRAAIADVL